MCVLAKSWIPIDVHQSIWPILPFHSVLATGCYRTGYSCASMHALRRVGSRLSINVEGYSQTTYGLGGTSILIP
jgi:hypothetical protein